MKYFKLMAAAMIGSATLTSCFKDEPLNAECDIEQAYIHVDNPQEMFFQKSDTLISVLSTAEDINFVVRKSTGLTSLAPQFRLTPGATIYPDNGSEQDFSNGPIEYTVTSEDKQYRRTYRINFMSSKDIMEYNFDNFFLNKTPLPANKYYVWSDIDSEENLLNNWANGNPGYRLAKGSATPEEYPTVPESEPGHETCVKLTTRETGDFGKRMKMPIAAGNLFLGEFDLSKATVANAKGEKGVLATRFGVPVSSQPISFSGFYKYKRGNVFPDKNEAEQDKQDFGSIYAVFYDNHDAEGKPFVLHGDDVLSSDQIISIANLGKIDETPEWTAFNINFTIQPGKTIDPVKLANRGYNLAIVSSSSINGAKFEGAIGSTLWIDNYSIKCANAE
nr:PCMD domain-containing protein [uncultured Prevotella sp.]